MAQKIGLGRGLDALIPTNDFAPHSATGANGVVEVNLSDIRFNPKQPRMARSLADLNLDELANSIKEHGVIQPLIVMRTQERDSDKPFTLIAGERRLRASQAAGLSHVPVIIKDYAPQQMLEVALIENIQRKDLNALEEANAYRQLITEFGLTQETAADRVGKSRSDVANTLRLLKLPSKAQTALMQSEITEGHGRALLSLDSLVDQLAMLDEIVKHGWNVRQTEEQIRRFKIGRVDTQKKPEAKPELSRELRDVENRLRDSLGTKVSLQRNRKGKGKIVIEFYSDEEFNTVYGKIVGSDEAR
jgi:ParB family chromosome partitioning protein